MPRFPSFFRTVSISSQILTSIFQPSPIFFEVFHSHNHQCLPILLYQVYSIRISFLAVYSNVPKSSCLRPSFSPNLFIFLISPRTLVESLSGRNASSFKLRTQTQPLGFPTVWGSSPPLYLSLKVPLRFLSSATRFLGIILRTSI